MSKTSFGDKGYNELTTGTTTGRWFAIKAVNGANAVVTILNAQGDDSTSLTIVSGDTVPVTATSIEVTSGTIHAYIQ